MTGRETNKVKLSKSILEMKFMKRTKEKVEKQLYQEEGEEYFGSQLTARMKKESGRYIQEQSFIFCEELNDGRYSFNGMNPEIERIMEQEALAKKAKEKPKIEADITDEQMAKRFKPSHITTMNNKFKTKKERGQESHRLNNDEPRSKKPKFLKPRD